MSKYIMNFKIDGMINIEAKTEKEAFKKCNNLTLEEIVKNGYDILVETKIVGITESINETLDWFKK